MLKKLLMLLAGIVFLLTAGMASADPMTVFVSIHPLKYFVERIGGDQVRVQCLTQPGMDPHSFEPRPQQMAQLSKAGAYFAIGLDFERAWLPKLAASNPNMTIVPADEGIQKIPMVEEHEGEEADHDHGGLDPHIWTSPKRVRVIADNILKALIRLDAAHQADYQKRFDAFRADLDALDADLTRIFKDRNGQKFLVFHPSWGYFAHDYGLVQVSIEMEGKEPKPAQIQALIERARRDGIKVVFAQPLMSRRAPEIISRAIDGQVVVSDPMAEDWLNNLKEQARKFEAALK